MRWPTPPLKLWIWLGGYYRSGAHRVTLADDMRDGGDQWIYIEDDDDRVSVRFRPNEIDALVTALQRAQQDARRERA